MPIQAFRPERFCGYGMLMIFIGMHWDILSLWGGMQERNQSP